MINIKSTHAFALRTKATLIYARTKNIRAVQILIGHSKLDNTSRYLGVELEVCYSVYSSSHQTSTDPLVTILKLDHEIPICESVSTLSSYRFHSMSEAEFNRYIDYLTVSTELQNGLAGMRRVSLGNLMLIFWLTHGSYTEKIANNTDNLRH